MQRSERSSDVWDVIPSLAHVYLARQAFPGSPHHRADVEATHQPSTTQPLPYHLSRPAIFTGRLVS
jgi:hypothetical protein